MLIITTAICAFMLSEPGNTCIQPFTNPHKKPAHGVSFGDHDNQGNSALCMADTNSTTIHNLC